VASIQPGSGTLPARRNNSQGARVVAAAALSRAPSGAVELTKWQPAISATAAVSSLEPPSATTTSPSSPEVAPGTSAASVGTSVRSDSRVAMIALNILVFWNPGLPIRVAPYHERLVELATT